MAATTLTGYLVRDAPWWKVAVAAYAIGGTASQNLFCAQHELSHFLAFRRPLYNRILSFASNCPLAVPMATAFRKYHQEHHSHLGVDGWDVDLPTRVEASVVGNGAAKLLWCFAYQAIYGVRPLLVRPKAPDSADALCLALVLGFDAAVAHAWGAKALAYFVAGALLGGGLHPMAGHLIAEHYTFLAGQETYSYYGPLNALTYNVGLHNEHHDFPQVGGGGRGGGRGGGGGGRSEGAGGRETARDPSPRPPRSRTRACTSCGPSRPSSTPRWPRTRRGCGSSGRF